MRGDGYDFHDSLDQERHDLAHEAQQVADDAVEASPGRALAVALDALDDADRAVIRASDAQHAALAAYRAALDAKARS